MLRSKIALTTGQSLAQFTSKRFCEKGLRHGGTHKKSEELGRDLRRVLFPRISLLERLLLEASAKHAGRKRHMLHASGVVPPGSTRIRSGFSSLSRRHARDALIRLHESPCWSGSCSRLCTDLPVRTDPVRGFCEARRTYAPRPGGGSTRIRQDPPRWSHPPGADPPERSTRNARIHLD